MCYAVFKLGTLRECVRSSGDKRGGDSNSIAARSESFLSEMDRLCSDPVCGAHTLVFPLYQLEEERQGPKI